MEKEQRFANRSEEISPYPHSNHSPLSHSSSFPSTSSPSLSSYHEHRYRSHSLPSNSILQNIQPRKKNQNWEEPMAAMNSSVLACSYAISGAGSSELNAKIGLVSSSSVGCGQKKQLMPVIRAQQADFAHEPNGRRAAMVFLAATLFSTAAVAANSYANAGVIDEYLEKSKANKELNDKKRLATSGANFARAYTVEFGTCKFPENFTGCQDLAKQKKVPFISDDLQLECEGKDKFKCGSNVFWKW